MISSVSIGEVGAEAAINTSNFSKTSAGVGKGPAPSGSKAAI
jgi:hypothetical protein